MFGFRKKVDFSEYAQSRMSPFDEQALHNLLEGKSGLRILEIGSWFGAGSTQIFQKHCKKLVCVDTWLGNDNADHRSIVSQIDPHQIFMENIEPFKDRVTAIRSDSSKIADLLQPQSFDFIFIDGDHRYEQTKLDIANSMILVAPNGILAGHDCEGRASEFRFSQSDLKIDHIRSPKKGFRHCHPGVITAVDEEFGDRANLFAEREPFDLNGSLGFSTIWHLTM